MKIAQSALDSRYFRSNWVGFDQKRLVDRVSATKLNAAPREKDGSIPTFARSKIVGRHAAASVSVRALIRGFDFDGHQNCDEAWESLPFPVDKLSGSARSGASSSPRVWLSI